MASHEYRAEITAKTTVTLFCDGYPLVRFSYRKFGGDLGWRAYPNTASGNPSRISHPTLLSAAGRYRKARTVLRDFCDANSEALETMKGKEV